MTLSDDVQKSLDILDQVLSEFEDVSSSSEITSAFSSPCDNGSEKGYSKTKKEVYFGVSTVERSMLQCQRRNLKDQSVSRSVSNLEKNLERVRLVPQNSLANTDVLTVSNVDDIKSATRCDLNQQTLNNDSEAIVPKNLLSFWLDREERTKTEFISTFTKGREQEQKARNIPPSKLPKPTNIVKPISKADQNLDSRLPKSKIPVSCDARNIDKSSSFQHLSNPPKTNTLKIPTENKINGAIQFCNNIANEALSNLLQPNLSEKSYDQSLESFQPKKEIQITNANNAEKFEDECKKTQHTHDSKIPVNNSNIEKYGSSPSSKSDNCFIPSVSLLERSRALERISSTLILNQEKGGRKKLLSEKETATIQCNETHCVVEEGIIEKSCQLHEVYKRNVAPKPPVEDLVEDSFISGKSKELVSDEKKLRRATASDSQTSNQKTTQSTQTTPPCMKQSKWSFPVEPCNSSAIENPQIRRKKRPFSVSPVYSVLDPRRDFEARYPARTNMFHSRQHLNSENDRYVATDGFFPQHLYRSLSVSQFMSMEDQIYQQLSIPESPNVLRSTQDKHHMHEFQQTNRANSHFLHRMSHAYHKNQRHSINLEHIMSLDQLDVRKAQFQAHSQSFNKRSRSFLENKADTRSLENQRTRSHKKPDALQRNVMKVMVQNKFDEELEYMTPDTQKFAPIIKDKFIRNANIYLPSSPSVLQLPENWTEKSDYKEISNDQNHPFPNSFLGEKMSNDSLCSSESVEESFKHNRSRSSTSFEYLPENKSSEYLMDSDSPESEKTQKTLVSSSEEITTLRQLISEGIIKLDEVPPGFVPPPPPVKIDKQDCDKRRKSHQTNVEESSFQSVTLSPIAKAGKKHGLKPLKSLDLEDSRRKKLQSNISKSTESLFRTGFQNSKISGSVKKEGRLETDDNRPGEKKKKNFLFSFWKRKQYTIDPL